MTTKKLNFSKMTLEQLQNSHSDMIITAEDLGYSPPDSVLQLFETVEAGAAICAEFHEGLTKFRAGLDEAAIDVASDSGEEQTETKPLPDTAKGRKIAKARAEAKKQKPEHPAPAEKEESTVAVAKKTAKKAPTKKAAAKKTPAKKAAARETRSAFDPDAKITWIYKGEGIGCREGTGKHDRHMAVKKADGKTVKAFLAAKGNSQSLAACVAEKKAKVG
jgi:type IV secretory pathway VirB10-like protein